MNPRILIVEDDPTITRVLRDNLKFEGFEVDVAVDGRAALASARKFAPDLILLDLTLPGLDGLEVCRRLTREPERTAIVVLTARGGKEDRIRGLELGADDYVTKPFALDELLARMRAVLRRTRKRPDEIVLGDVRIDFRHMRAVKNDVPISLTDREFAVLRRLADRIGSAVTRDELLSVVWGYENVPLTRTVDNLIARLRRKVEPDPHHPRFIRTAHGDGYRLTP